MTTRNPIADAILAVGASPNVPDANLEPANLVDGMALIAAAIRDLARATNRQAEALESDRVNTPIV
jgi:hypothetical protein